MRKQKKKYNWQFWAIPKIALDDKKLEIEEILLLGILVTMMNGENVAWPSQKQLAKYLRRTTRTIIKYVKHLEELGYLIIERNTQFKVNQYSIEIPTGETISDGSELHIDMKPTSPPFFLKKEHINKEISETSSDLSIIPLESTPIKGNEIEEVKRFFVSLTQETFKYTPVINHAMAGSMIKRLLKGGLTVQNLKDIIYCDAYAKTHGDKKFFTFGMSLNEYSINRWKEQNSIE